MSIFSNPIIVTLSDTEPLVSLQTYDAKHGWSQRFYLTKEALHSQLSDGVEHSVTETDLMNISTVSRISNSICFRMFWLHGNYDDDIVGYQQTFTVPVDKVEKVMAGGMIKYLSYTPICKGTADIFFTKTAHEAIAEMDKLKRHALRRFLRDNFNYGRDEHLVVQKDEWINGFCFFSATNRYEGGIVLHDTKIKGKDGKPYPKLYFGLHT